jgi:hypothetical protein
MKKFKVQLSWFASMRGYDEITVEAENAQDAKEIAWDAIEIDYNEHIKIIDSDHEIDSVTEVEQ